MSRASSRRRAPATARSSWSRRTRAGSSYPAAADLRSTHAIAPRVLEEDAGRWNGKPERISSPMTSAAVDDRAAAHARASRVLLVVVLGAVNAIGPLSIDMY